MANLTKDARLIRDNPGMSAADLLNLGLSQGAYEELLKQQENPYGTTETPKKPVIPNPVTKIQDNETFPDLRKVPPTVTKEASTQPQRAVPKINTGAPMDSNSEMAVLIDNTTGKRTPMQRSFAIKWAVKPNHKGRYSVE
jgi:hypothetical protein